MGPERNGAASKTSKICCTPLIVAFAFALGISAVRPVIGFAGESLPSAEVAGGEAAVSITADQADRQAGRGPHRRCKIILQTRVNKIEWVRSQPKRHLRRRLEIPMS